MNVFMLTLYISCMYINNGLYNAMYMYMYKDSLSVIMCFSLSRKSPQNEDCDELFP